MNQIILQKDLTPSDEDFDYAPERSIRTHSRQALIASVVLVFGLGLAAAVIPIGGAVIGSGQIGVESHVKRVAHPQGGVISAISVKDGDAVRKGQALMRLDSAVSGTSADFSTQSLFQMLAQRAALEAERDGLSRVRFPRELTASASPAAREAMAMEQRGFDLRMAEDRGIQNQLGERVNQLNQQIAGYRAQIAALEDQQKLIEPELAGVRKLWDRQLVTINKLNSLERTRVDMRGSIAALQAQIAQAQGRIAETREQAISTRQSRRAEAATQLARIMETLNEQQVQKASSTDQFERSIIRAPADGIVDKLAYTTIGDVIRPAETIMSIVPSKDELVVEASISPADVDQVAAGQSAQMRFTAFNTQTTPEVHGSVIYVAPERSVDEHSGLSFYRIRVQLNAKEIQALKQPLKPGMPVEVYVSTGSRSMLSYVTKPMRDQLARAFRDQ